MLRTSFFEENIRTTGSFAVVDDIVFIVNFQQWVAHVSFILDLKAYTKSCENLEISIYWIEFAQIEVKSKDNLGLVDF